jgi:hypothetical protein
MPRPKTAKRETRKSDRSNSSESRSMPSAPRVEASPIEAGFDMWNRYARETGETVTSFLRRFGEEQQKNYATWAANVSETMRPKLQEAEAPSVRARFDEWNRQAEEVGRRVREAFEKSFTPQKDLLELWVKPLVPDDATLADRNQEMLGLVQKLWTGLTMDLGQRLLESMQPEKSFDEFVRSQDEATKQFTENFQKLTRLYFTSPGFVAGFGKSLDSSLDLQKNLQDSDEFFRRVTGLPTRREISELNQAVRDLSQQVSRLNGKRA